MPHLPGTANRITFLAGEESCWDADAAEWLWMHPNFSVEGSSPALKHLHRIMFTYKKNPNFFPIGNGFGFFVHVRDIIY
jgi:hypothetical protein